jgi:phosphatidylglycerophosphatase C
MSTTPGSPPDVVVAFDVDGTLTIRDCVVPFLRQSVGTRKLVLTMVRTPIASLAALARRDRDALKALALQSLRGRSVEEIDERGRGFAAHVARRWLRTDTNARLKWHLSQGHQVILVSASLRPYLQPLAEHLGASAVLCCELAEANGLLTGDIQGANCRGPEKERRVREWLGARVVELWAYGDSSGDRELVSMAAHRGYLVKDVVVVDAP